MGEHLQYPELRDKLDALFLGESPTGYLQVYEPERGSSVEFLRDEYKGRVWLRFGLKGEDERGLAAARRLKLPKPTFETLRFFDGRTFGHYSFRCRVGGPDDAARRALSILSEVRQVSGGQWLWITDDPQPDQWPSPLPRPERWPPSG